MEEAFLLEYLMRYKWGEVYSQRQFESFKQTFGKGIKAASMGADRGCQQKSRQ